jgi:hypothetical protein
MLRHERTESETPAVASYRPVPRQDEMTDAHIEDYLDHRFAPLIGSVSYEERQNLRAELRQEIQSLAAAHEELGSTRQQAIALALNSLAAPQVAMSSRRASAVSQVEAESVNAPNSLRTALFSFGAASLSTLSVAYLARHTSGDAILPVMAMILVVFPFVAGAIVGGKRVGRPLRAMILAQLLLYVPFTLIFAMLVNSEVHNSPVTFELMPYTAAYTAISTLFGGVGIHAGNWLKQSVSRLTGKRKRTES